MLCAPFPVSGMLDCLANCLVIEPDVENPALESVRLRRALGDPVLAADVIVASEHRVQEWRDVRGSLIHAALAEGRGALRV